MNEQLELIADLKILCKMQKVYAEIYRKYNLVNDINDEYVHITENAFFKLFSTGYTEKHPYTAAYPYQYTAEYNGVKIICITAERRLEVK